MLLLFLPCATGAPMGLGQICLTLSKPWPWQSTLESARVREIETGCKPFLQRRNEWFTQGCRKSMPGDLIHSSLASQPRTQITAGSVFVPDEDFHQTATKRDSKALICYFSFPKCLEPFQTCMTEGDLGAVQCRGSFQTFWAVPAGWAQTSHVHWV